MGGCSEGFPPHLGRGTRKKIEPCIKSMAAGGPPFRQVAAGAIGRWQQAFGGGRRRSCPPGRGARRPILRELYF